MVRLICLAGLGLGSALAMAARPETKPLPQPAAPAVLAATALQA